MNIWTANSIHTFEGGYLSIYDLITKGFGAGGAKFQGFGAGGDGFSQSYYPGAANSIHTLELEVPSSNNLKVNPNKNKTQRLSKLSKFTVINI